MSHLVSARPYPPGPVAAASSYSPQEFFELEARRRELERCLREARTLAGVDPATCRWLEEKLAQGIFNLVVVGEFKRSKSTLINALLGEPLLPSGVVPLTSVVTVLRSGPER